jgi:DNA-directed RNA polymerase II subunit RPB2
MAGVIAEEMAISTRVMVNGDLVGIIRNENANTAVQCLRALRRHGHIAGSISIAWDCFTNEISILTDGGRFSYPALIVNSTFNDVLLDLSKVDENNHPIVNWSEAVAPRNTPKAINLYNGATIEYLDAAESDTIMMAESLNVLRANSISNPTYKTYTHCFLSPHAVKGIMSAKIPFADMNQGARNCFVSNMGKQVIGRYVSNIHDRMDNTANELVYPNLPICQTNSNKYFGLDYLLHGCMSMVAMMSMGINQEDALVINGDSVSSLFMSSIYYRVYEDKLKSVSNTREQFNVPPVAQIKFVKEGLQRSFDKGIIDATTGFPHLKRRITGGDVIIPKYIEAKGEKFVDASTYVRINEGGIISKIVPGPDDQKTDEDGNYFCKVQTAELRKVDTGHKMATTSAQKGIVGAVTSSVDLPSTGNGITPELVMNPHGIPSRMTVSQMAECYISQVAMVTGKFYDATPFNHFSHDEFKELHKRYGLDIAGERIMYDGITGMQIKTPIFIGPLYYTRLKHMVEDKIHYRTEVGPVQLRTRQPSEGRSRNGGLRLGEMERDCFVAHGVAAFLRERMMNSSDMFKIHVGTETGAIIPSNPETNFYQYDGKFDDKEEIVEVQLPFASVVFLHTLNACGIEANIKTE